MDADIIGVPVDARGRLTGEAVTSVLDGLGPEDAERVVDAALHRLRQSRRGLQVTWVPNPRLRLRTGIVKPDILVLGPAGRWGALEIDGPSHRGKWAADRSKDMRIEDAGAAYVGRIDVAATVPLDVAPEASRTVKPKDSVPLALRPGV